jgi:hypothetical protein
VAVLPVDVDLALGDDQGVDLALIQWHTPVPDPTAQDLAIAAYIAKGKEGILSELIAWLGDDPRRCKTYRPLFVVAPELSLPYSLDNKLMELASSVERPVVIIAGFEYLAWEDYQAAVRRSKNPGSERDWLNNPDARPYVNAARILIRDSSGTISQFVQPKQYPADPEAHLLPKGLPAILFRSQAAPGQRINFAARVCSDLSHPDKARQFRRDCALAAPASPLDITFVLQCNEDQAATQFLQSIQAYFEPPVAMTETDVGCLVFVNNAGSERGSLQQFGYSQALRHLSVIDERTFSDRA